MSNKNDTNNENSLDASAEGRLPKGMKPAPAQPWEHHYWTDAMTRLGVAVMNERDAAIIALVGPTGVGKSTVIAALLQRVFEECFEEFQDPGRVPWGYVEVRSCENRKRVWGATVRHLLASLHEPLIGRKIKPDTHDTKVRNKDDQGVLDIEAVCANRKTRILVMDEFHHLLRGTETDSQQRKLEMLKGLSNNTGVKTVIVGTTDILKALDTYGETGRRTVRVMLPRYRLTKEDLSDYRLVLTEIEASLGPELAYRLSENLAYAWEGTKGCVGILASWLENSRAVARSAGTPITKAILDAEMKPARTLKKIDEEAKECEEYVAQNAKDADEQLKKTEAAIKTALG